MWNVLICGLLSAYLSPIYDLAKGRYLGSAVLPRCSNTPNTIKQLQLNPQMILTTSIDANFKFEDFKLLSKCPSPSPGIIV